MYRRLTSRSVTSDTLERVLTIDELARETGLTVRNVRSHHARGLLPPPEVRGRTGYYGPEHVERLRLIQRLQGEGMKLSGIKRLLADPGERLLALKEASLEAPETSEVVSAADLAARLRLTEMDDPRKLIAKATKLGLLHPLGEGRYEVPSPALLAAAEQVVARGVRLEHALDMLDSVQRHSRAVSREFVKLFVDDVLKPYADAERWDELAESIQASRPLAAQALLAVFRRTMDDEVEATFNDLARTLTRRK
jgi:DNA-binding transcriptional MerR regulator